MPSYQTYSDVLSENTGRRNVFGSSIVTLLVLAAALVAVSVFQIL